MISALWFTLPVIVGGDRPMLAVLLKSSITGSWSGSAIPKLGERRTAAAHDHSLRLAPVMINPPIRTFGPVPTWARVEIFCSRADCGAAHRIHSRVRRRVVRIGVRGGVDGIGRADLVRGIGISPDRNSAEQIPRLRITDKFLLDGNRDHPVRREAGSVGYVRRLVVFGSPRTRADDRRGDGSIFE